MSRYTAAVEKDSHQLTVAWGMDHAVGWFFQVFDAQQECIVDLDALFDGLTLAELRVLLEAFEVRQS
ncbi:MAG: hypothetical protein Kow00124_31570 [Anaerolineae bacterium]